MKTLKYVPVFRSRQQELAVLKSYNFGHQIFPCVEIIKELDRLPSVPRKNTKNPPKLPKGKTFEDVYIPLLRDIQASKVFVDLPVHLKDSNSMKNETVFFLRRVVADRVKRTEYMLKLSSLSEKVIPVISTYNQRTGEKGSINVQVNDLRPTFPMLAFRTFPKTFSSDIGQIRANAKKTDYIIFDWGEDVLDLGDDDQIEIIDHLAALPGHVIIHRNSIPKDVTNVGLKHGKAIESIDNSLLEVFADFGGLSFSDYSGIKKDDIGKGGTISPGFLYYDASLNKFFGYKGNRPKLSEYEDTIVPDVISSLATRRMNGHVLDFLCDDNNGWRTILAIQAKTLSGRTPARFKRIAMEHYLHCIKQKIMNGDFD